VSVPVSSNPIENAIENLREAFKERDRVTGRELRRATTQMILFRVDAFLKVYDAAMYATSLGEEADINTVLYGKKK
jgi:hypothetical protein